ncbi:MULTISPECIES: LPS translocon maturation chaperone LptM [unclassified Wenzhouxiangella]|uniref:LPS translocon maturation chaperone LptM n=1 Tax=unclassified Wenzhouxiangella TaxID=2613841 RepID=UPI0011C0429D|nr:MULTISPECIES: lipoprotein [unclassified Wenzhouxiangella]
MRASLTVLAVVLLVIAVLVNTGCGLKGDLYLPEDEPATAPSEADEDEEAGKQSDSSGA